MHMHLVTDPENPLSVAGASVAEVIAGNPPVYPDCAIGRLNGTAVQTRPAHYIKRKFEHSLRRDDAAVAEIRAIEHAVAGGLGATKDLFQSEGIYSLTLPYIEGRFGKSEMASEHFHSVGVKWRQACVS